ncbi:hypothetical protein PCL_00896 [Purpureocillium lilacinum]|uniref:Uncharacterized protein n=1 Tax=Purpureocillium lilacinum TaxID=33203 RepID=A0A2U3E432_PURLI|nr:hypothetical protein PCL_00896 [Purpureocillium lilacinum]
MQEPNLELSDDGPSVLSVHSSASPIHHGKRANQNSPTAPNQKQRRPLRRCGTEGNRRCWRWAEGATGAETGAEGAHGAPRRRLEPSMFPGWVEETPDARGSNVRKLEFTHRCPLLGDLSCD